MTESREKGLKLLYERYGRKLYTYGVKNWQLEEDESWELVYKTLYKVSDAVTQYSFESEEKFSSLLFRVFINYLRNHYRDEKRKGEKADMVTLEDTLSTNIPADHAEQEEQQPASLKMILLKDELEKLQDWERMLLLLRSQDLPYSEIAKFVNKPEKNLKVYYQRLKAMLSGKLTGALTKAKGQ